MKKKAFCLVLLFFAMVPAAHAVTSAKVGPMIGAWNVTLQDTTEVTWSIGDNVYVSESGKSHIAYGFKNPGNVEFVLYWSSYLQDSFGDMEGKKYAYIEQAHATVTSPSDLPQTEDPYSFFIPTGDSTDNFTCFNAVGDGGPYTLKSGARENAVCEPPVEDNCTLQRIIPATVFKLSAFVQPVAPFVIIGSADAAFAQGAKAEFSAKGIIPVLQLKIGGRILIVVAILNPFNLSAGDVDVTVGDCTGSITVK